MQYLYETHLHTCQGSKCGVSTGAEQAKYYQSLGYTGIIMTDHFLGGNTAVPKDLCWEDRMRIFCSGYEDALRTGKEIGLDVFFGWEQYFEGDEYLIYGLSPEYLYAHPEVEFWTREDQLREVHAAGGCVVQAHPCRARDYIRLVTIGDVFADGIEAANFANQPEWDAMAYRFGQEHQLVMTAGSDNHHAQGYIDKGAKPFATAFDKPLRGIGDYVDAILNHRQPHLVVSEGRFLGNAEPPRDVYRFRPDGTRALFYAHPEDGSTEKA